jgi:hypothetical protein
MTRMGRTVGMAVAPIALLAGCGPALAAAHDAVAPAPLPVVRSYGPTPPPETVRFAPLPLSQSGLAPRVPHRFLAPSHPRRVHPVQPLSPLRRPHDTVTAMAMRVATALCGAVVGALIGAVFGMATV